MGLRKTFEKILFEWPSVTHQLFADNEFGHFFRVDFRAGIESLAHEIDPDFIVQASVGQGNWANVPWLSILDPEITTSTQTGLYPVYLICADGSGFYLSLNQGITRPRKELGQQRAAAFTAEVKHLLLTQLPEFGGWDTGPLDLQATTTTGRSYQEPSIAARFYQKGNIPADDVLAADLIAMLGLYQKAKPVYLNHVSTLGPGERDSDGVADTHADAAIELPKPFLLLAGISGTGKSRFVREQARRSSHRPDNFCMVAVRPDWHDPSDLLGYVSRLEGSPRYVVTDVLRFIVQAWRAVIAAGIRLTGQPGRAQASGTRQQLDTVVPYWLCLDEMNLAPVEQYFADYLALIETRQWQWDGDHFRYHCDALLRPELLDSLDEQGKQSLAAGLGLMTPTEDVDNAALWAHFLQTGITIPPNLIVAGTVNMDETTHGFSRKVLDRALSLDFGEFYPNNFKDFFSDAIEHRLFTYPRLASSRDVVIKPERGKIIDSSLAFLEDVNTVLRGTPFELAYRALNELLLAVLAHDPDDEVTLQAVWDDFIMQKVLPRIAGDTDRLRTAADDPESNDGHLLQALMTVLSHNLERIWFEENARPDLYRTRHGKTPYISCRSRKALERMLRRLTQSGFASFWP